MVKDQRSFVSYLRQIDADLICLFCFPCKEGEIIISSDVMGPSVYFGLYFQIFFQIFLLSTMDHAK